MIVCTPHRRSLALPWPSSSHDAVNLCAVAGYTAHPAEGLWVHGSGELWGSGEVSNAVLVLSACRLTLRRDRLLDVDAMLSRHA